MTSFVYTALISGLRSRSFQMILLLGALLVGAAHLAALFSPRQPQTVALDVGLSGLRFTLVLLALFWIQELVSKEIERRTVILALAYPVSRAQYLLGRYAGIGLLLAIATIMLGTLLWLVIYYSDRSYAAAHPVDLGLPYWIALCGAYLDVMVVTAFALCLAALSTIAMLPLALGAAFAIACRSIGPVIDLLLVRGGDGDAELSARFGPVVGGLRWLLPDLSRLDWRDWPMYRIAPSGDSLLWSATMALAFIALLLALATWTFNRRDFA